MPQAVDAFLDCCQRLLQGDAALIALLRTQGFACTPASWTFSLPALHAFLAPQLADGKALEYRTFVRQLFASQINLRLREQGAEIAIADNRGKVSASLYCLRHRPA